MTYMKQIIEAEQSIAADVIEKIINDKLEMATNVKHWMRWDSYPEKNIQAWIACMDEAFDELAHERWNEAVAMGGLDISQSDKIPSIKSLLEK